MKKDNRNTFLKNALFLLAIIVICAIMIRTLLSGETLSDYADKNPSAAYGTETSQEDLSESPTTDNTVSSADTVLNPTTVSENNVSDNNPETTTYNESATNQTAVSDSSRITYETDFYYEELSDSIKQRITGLSYPQNDSDAEISYDDLRYLHVLYYNFDNTIMDGEIICNKAIAQDLIEIFSALYHAEYQIDKIQLIDDYNADDELSMENDNTSCFNYRVVEGSTKLSNHAYGLAIDLNPFYNPDVTTSDDGTTEVFPIGSDTYADRDADFDHKIDQSDLAYQLFTQHGFTWGGNWHSLKDYQHFEKN